MRTRDFLSPFVVCLPLLAAQPATPADYDAVHWLDQGWEQRDADIWYDLTQGSQLIPMAWMEALETPDGDRFADRAFFQRFGFPYADPERRWPIGFVLDEGSDGTRYLGLNCAACHTSDLTYDGHTVLIHGGQSFGDLQALVQALTGAVRATLADGTAFDRFHQRTGADRHALRMEMERWLAEREAIDRVFDGAPEWLPGRTDAVSVINATTIRSVSSELTFEVKPGNAPVNFPPAWNANQQERLQHSGLVSNGANLGILDNAKIGALARNISEAYAVFSPVRVDTSGKVHSEVDLANLIDIERALSHLHSPRWPEDILGKIDADLAHRGAEIFARECAECHGTLAPEDTDTDIPLKLSRTAPAPEAFVFVQSVVDETLTTEAQAFGIPPDPTLIGTDPMMVCNFLMGRMDTGTLAGKRKKNAPFSKAYFDIYPQEDMITEVMAGMLIREVTQQFPTLVASQAQNEMEELSHIVKGWFIDEQATGIVKPQQVPGEPPQDTLNRIRATCADYAVRMNRTDPEAFPMPGYKTRPLNGLWATPPFLHNGSVPTLWHLLQPVAERPTRFHVGSRAFDPVLLGLADLDGPAGKEFRVYDDTGALIVGNWNGGHDYGTDLDEDEKKALIEFVKTQ